MLCPSRLCKTRDLGALKENKNHGFKRRIEARALQVCKV
jgi:hypothetical protein